MILDTLVKDAVFEKIGDGIKPDAKRRVLLQGIQIQAGNHSCFRNMAVQ